MVRCCLFWWFWKPCCLLIFYLISPCWVMNVWHRCGQLEGVCTMWLSELGTSVMFYGLKKPSITKTDILWYSLHEYVCWFYRNAHIPCPSAPWLSLTPAMNLHYSYPMTQPLQIVMIIHELTTELKKSVCYASRCPSQDQDMRIENVVEGATYAGRKLSE